MKLWQLKELSSQGFEVILVTSGAVGLGRQRLRYRKLANSRFLEFIFCDDCISFSMKNYILSFPIT